VIDAQEHLASCAACQQFVRDMRALGDAIREAAPREQAPAEVRGRLFAAVARARAGLQPSPRGRGRASWLAAAVLLVALAGALTADRLRRDGPDARIDPISAIAEDHATALGETRIASADPAEVTRWLERQVHFAMHVPVLPGARLLGARLCVTDDRRGAAVEYEVNGVAVSYFVVPDGARDAHSAKPPRFDRTTRVGYHVVSWREPGLLHAMVGNLPASRLATLAEACVEQARRAVAWMGGRAYEHEQEG
jgi:anti-sigma factor RsiW